ncbi:MAG: nicotinamide mononucleotide transporter [Armatimonadetes bacterium]|nr:nicotinamide mononucleotide transporter [Armatimonadota bacterium]
MPRTAAFAVLVVWAIVSAVFIWAAATQHVPAGWLTQGWLEAVGITTSVLFAWLEVRESPWNWPVAIVASLAYIEFFRRSGFYANMWLQLYYVVLSVIGWYWWVKGGERKTALPIVRADRRVWLVFLAITAVAVPLTYGLMYKIHHEAKPLDVVTAVLSIGAEALLARKIIENWWVWIVVNALTVYMLRESLFSAGLYAFFLVLSVMGLVEWRRGLAVAEVPKSASDA